MEHSYKNPQEHTLDMIIIGGGINGAGIAADAAGRGLSVALYEAQDFASATSSASSKLIHGGLRYLEHYEFRLVSEALSEREILLRKAPHLVKPMRFRLPHRPFLRPAWMIYAGLFLYDFMAKRSTLPRSRRINLSETGYMQPEMKIGFEYADCWADDARLVLGNIMAAQKNGAQICNYCVAEKITKKEDLWHVTLHDTYTDTRFERKAKALINAAGPWVKQIFDEVLHEKSPRNIRLIKGSHIVVPKLHDGLEAYILQNKDKRIVFVIPYLKAFSIIGTTDVEYKDDPRKVAISQEEIDYLLAVSNEHFLKQLSHDDIVWSYSGVRPLCDDESDSPQAITRDYTLELQDSAGRLPVLSVFGGKLTTYRRLAEAALDKLAPFFPTMGKKWTANVPLPGGNFSCSHKKFAKSVRGRYPWLTEEQTLRYITQFGADTYNMLENAQSLADMGECVAQDVYQREIDYSITVEFVKTPEDFLWRRTKLGLFLNEDEQNAVNTYILQKLASL